MILRPLTCRSRSDSGRLCAARSSLCEQKSRNFLARLCFVLMFVPAVAIERRRGKRSSAVVTLFNINSLNRPHFGIAATQTTVQSCCLL